MLLNEQNVSVLRTFKKILVCISLLTVFSLPLHREVHAKKRSETVGSLLKRLGKKPKKIRLSKKKSSLPSFQKIKINRVNLSKVKPPAISKLYYSENSDEVELEKATDEGIREIYKLTKRYKKSSQRGELWLRLAELYVEKARLIEFRLHNEFDKKMEEYNNKKRRKKPKLRLYKAASYNKKAVQLYEWFLRDFPKDKKIDQALFFLGYNYFELGQEDKGQKYYSRLTREYPRSIYVEEAHFALGEYHFEKENWKQALRHYVKVTSNRRARLYSFALYKIAWSQFKLGKSKYALKSLEKVIGVGRRTKGSGDRTASGVSRIRLATEALRDIVVFYSESGRYKGARQYFKKLTGKKDVTKYMERLAQYYQDSGNRPAATYLYKELIVLDPESPKAFQYQHQVVRMNSSEGDKKFRKELLAWIDKFGTESDWYEQNRSKGEMVERSQKLIESTLRNYVLQHHQTAQNSRGAYSRKLARRGYELYFEAFENSKRSDEMHFFHGELLFDMRKYREAAKSYTWVYENRKDSQYYEKSVLNTVLALEKQLPPVKTIKKKIGKDNDPIEFNPLTKEFIEAGKQYLSTFPDGENRVAIQYKLGALYYYNNHFDDAEDMFKTIIKNSPKTKFAEYSANLLLDIYNIKQDYRGLEKAAEDILSVPGLQSLQVGAQVKGIKQRTAFKRINELEKSGDHKEAGLAYSKYAQENKNTKLAAIAHYNAAINFEKGQMFGEAIQAYTGFLTARVQKKDSEYQKLKKNSLRFRALLYEKTGHYRKAYKAFEFYANKYPRDPSSLDFLYNAGLIRYALRHYKKANSNFEKYYKKSKSRDRADVLFLVAESYEKRKKWSTAILKYDKYIVASRYRGKEVVEASFRIAKLYQKLGNKKRAKKWFKNTIAFYRQFKRRGPAVGTRYAAESEFHLVRPTYYKLRSIKIPRSQKAQSKAVKNKLALIDLLKKELKKIVVYNDKYQVVSALTLEGQANQHMAVAIYKAPAPKGLSKKDLKVYRAGVAKIADPFKEQAMKSYSVAIKKGLQLQVYSPWLKSAFSEMHSLDQNLYKKYDFQIFDQTKLALVPEYVVNEKNEKAFESLEKIQGTSSESALVGPASQILSSDPTNLKALNVLARYYYRVSDYGMAELLLNRALQTHKDNGILLNNLAMVKLAQKKLRSGLELLNQCKSKDGSELCRFNLSILALKYQDYSLAQELLKGLESDKLESDELKLQVETNLAVTLSYLGDYENADQKFKKLSEMKSVKTQTLWSYAILAVEMKKDKALSQKVLDQIKSRAQDVRLLKKVKSLEERVKAL